jgi:3',5'-cyclic AMP phosphodiesterase CpdA
MVSANNKPAPMADAPATEPPFALAHLSDPHISAISDVRVRDLINKRLYGYLKWKLHRGAEHLDAILLALQDDLKQTHPGHIAVTGDLTHLSLPTEFRKARQWLQSLGPPTRVTVIPGNHDAYVKTDWNQTFAHWTDYMISDDSRVADVIPSNVDSIFPSLRVRGRIALIGVCTAQPTAPYLAVGSVGAIQMQKLKTILVRTGEQRLFRVLLIHHSPAPGTVSWRKRLKDAAALRSLLARYGADLILHGHAHHTAQSYLKSLDGKVPVVGAPSASALGRTLQRRARYYIYRISPTTSGWDVRLEVRMYSPDKNRFIPEHEQQMNRSR